MMENNIQMTNFDGLTKEDILTFPESAAFNSTSENCGSAMETLSRGFDVFAVKSNPKRKVFRIVVSSGNEFYLKIFREQSFFFNVFRNHAKLEYLAGRELDKAGVPVIEYLAWGGIGRMTFVLSRGIAGAVSGRRFFFEKAFNDKMARLEFLDGVSNLAMLLKKKHFLHRDFHSGNIIFDPSENIFKLVDAWGIEADSVFRKKSELELTGIWMELKNYLSDNEIIDGFISSGLSKNKLDALELLEKASLCFESKEHRRRGKIEKRIMSGNSKFATLQEKDSISYFWRHNMFFVPPERFEIGKEWERVEFEDASIAEREWLDSFIKADLERLPVLFVRHQCGIAELYYSISKTPEGQQNG